jgi:hypothetical protein
MTKTTRPADRKILAGKLVRLDDQRSQQQEDTMTETTIAASDLTIDQIETATADSAPFLCIRDGELVVLMGHDLITPIRDLDDLHAIIDVTGGCNCSDSVQFPKEYTDNVVIWALCRQILTECS